MTQLITVRGIHPSVEEVLVPFIYDEEPTYAAICGVMDSKGEVTIHFLRPGYSPDDPVPEGFLGYARSTNVLDHYEDDDVLRALPDGQIGMLFSADGYYSVFTNENNILVKRWRQHGPGYVASKAPHVPQEWVQFTDANFDDIVWRVHLPFMLSRYECTFGKGCPGLVVGERGKEPSPHRTQQNGCCSHGAYFASQEDLNAVADRVERMTAEDLVEPARLKRVKDQKWAVVFSNDEETFNAKTAVMGGACVFANRTAEKIGCAFIHQAAREQGIPVSEVDHTKAMPQVCWQLPIKVDELADEENRQQVFTITPWTANRWDMDAPLDWWCVDSGTNYHAEQMFWVSYRRELIATMGEENYEILATRMKHTIAGLWSVMPGQLEAMSDRVDGISPQFDAYLQRRP